MVRCVTPAGPLRTASGSHTDPALAERCAWNSTDAISLGTELPHFRGDSRGSRPDTYPRMTGYEACAAMKADDAVKHIPVVFLSAKGQESEIRSGLDAGAVEYMLKPFAPDELTQRVRELLEKYKK